MERDLLPPEVQAELARLGSADLVVGFVTAGPGAPSAAVTEAVRSALDTPFGEQTAVVVHADLAAAEERGAQLAQALGGRPVVSVAGMRPAPGTAAAGVATIGAGRDEGIRAILTAGRELRARAIVVLNPELTSTTAAWPASLAGAVLKEDCGLALPVYHRGRYEGTLTHALVAPLIRALFGKRLTNPLAEEFGCSAAAATAFLDQDVWGSDLARNGLEFWLPARAIEAGLPLGQASLGPRTVPPVARPAPLGAVVGRVASSLFAIAEGLEAAWLDLRGSEPVTTFGPPPEPPAVGLPVDPERMLIGFRQGVRDLYPIWEKILAPDNLGEILVLSDAGPEDFRIPDRLWARIIYDFLLAYRARVVYRSHVAQSLAPLYLGYAASLILQTRARPPAAVPDAGDRLGREFEEQKPYLVDRWR